MNKIWTGIIVISLVYGFLTFRYEEMAKMILSLPMDAFTLVITLVMSACFWNGLMSVMYDIGVISLIAKGLSPLLNLIMPKLKDKEAREYISSNIAANMFGLGYAATPSGLKAMKRLKELSREEEHVASDEMITFLVLNTGGVTLIPTTVLAIRSKYGALNPADFIILAIISTTFACVVGLLSDRFFLKRGKKR